MNRSNRIYGVLFLLSVFSVSVFAQNTVSGVVFEDTNDNSKREQTEKGIAGVGYPLKLSSMTTVIWQAETYV
ncbi:MAG: hypothetical protein KF855_00855 [Acidobacteria bacterium]|nr:hypothetical protein [Acidobacteriota bacterium]